MNKKVKMLTFSFLNQTLWCDPHWNRLSESIPMSGNTIGFGWEIRKLAFWKLSILDFICCPDYCMCCKKTNTLKVTFILQNMDCKGRYYLWKIRYWMFIPATSLYTFDKDETSNNGKHYRLKLILVTHWMLGNFQKIGLKCCLLFKTLKICWWYRKT